MTRFLVVIFRVGRESVTIFQYLFRYMFTGWGALPRGDGGQLEHFLLL